VFSGNLWWGKADSDGLVDLIREHNVDVFATQEMGFENAEAISSELPYGMLEPDHQFQGMGIALRHPAKYERIPLTFRDARRVVLEPAEWGGLERAIDFVNVHFQAPHSPWPFPPPLIRFRQMRGMERFFAENPSDARIVVGDYNAAPGWPLYRRMTRHLTDAALRSAEREGRTVEPTWGPTAESRRLFRIDHAMVRGIEVENFRVVDIPGSDHSGLIFDCSPTVSE
jgi:endonuclease/exonuclease/phosphatase family metal-dependent hydrolase